jgi:hypothetical protein
MEVFSNQSSRSQRGDGERRSLFVNRQQIEANQDESQSPEALKNRENM